MTMRTPRSVFNDSLPEAPLSFCCNQDKEPIPLLAQYKQLCPGGLNEGARDAKQPEASVSKTFTKETATEEQGKKKKKTRRRKGYAKFTS